MLRRPTWSGGEAGPIELEAVEVVRFLLVGTVS